MGAADGSGGGCLMEDKKYMQLALAEARKAAELGEIPIGAVLADKIGRAHV